MSINESEQWLLNGDCELCRKKSYCTKDCKKRKANMRSAILSYIDKRTDGLFSTVQNKLYDENGGFDYIN